MRLIPFKENSFKVNGAPDEYMINFMLDAAGNVVEVHLLEPGNVINKAYPKRAQ